MENRNRNCRDARDAHRQKTKLRLLVLFVAGRPKASLHLHVLPGWPALIQAAGDALYLCPLHALHVLLLPSELCVSASLRFIVF
jgi:hypothetical protein